MGRTKLIQTPEEMWSLFEEYKKETKDNPILKHVFVGKDGSSAMEKKERPLTFEGFENYLVLNKIITDVSDYFENKDNRYKDYVPVCRAIKRIIRQDQIEGGMVGIYNPSVTQRLNGLVDKTQAEVKADVKVEDVTIKIFDSKEEKK